MRLIIILAIFFIVIFTGCSKKATVATYSNVNVPLKNLKHVDITIEGSDLFTQRLYERIPTVFLGEEILIDDPNSPNILHITENPIRRSTKIEDSEEIKQVKYFRQVYNSDLKKYETRITYVDRVYYKRCWIDSFELSSRVTTRYQRDTISTEISKEICRTQRYDIFFPRPSRNYDEDSIYQELVRTLRDKIINYLVPYIVYYNIELEEDLDVKLSLKDKEIFDTILGQIDKGIPLPMMIEKLEVLNTKYPNSYTIHFTIGVLHEIFGEFENALVNYHKAFQIKPENRVLNRIKKVKENRFNLERIDYKEDESFLK